MQAALHRAEECFWKKWWNKFPPTCFGFLSEKPSSTPHESSNGASPLQPVWRRKRKECITTVAEATLQTKSSMVNVTHSCRNPNRNSLARAEQAHRAGQKGNDWDQPRGAVLFCLVVVPSSLRPNWHYKPRKCWTGRFLVCVSKAVVSTHKQWLTETYFKETTQQF